MRLLTDAFILAAAAGGRRIGDSVAPDNNARPYAVVYPMFISDQDGTLANPTVDGWYEYQVTAVGDTREQAQGLADELEALLLASTFTVSGYRCHPIFRTEKLPIERDDSMPPPLYYQSVGFKIFVTPSP